jgi:hypothetical protein
MTPRNVAVAALLCAGLLAAAAPAHAASIPAWLDEGITNWNQANPDAAIRFVTIKDTYVWYDMPKAQDLGQKQIRERLKAIVHRNGYEPMDEEDLVTTGKPPVASGRSTPKKCWSRSFVYSIKAQSDTKAVGDDETAGQRQRLLSSLICEDSSVWWAAFRVAE